MVKKFMGGRLPSFTPPLDGNNARAHPVAHASLDKCPYPEGTAGYCLSLDDSAALEPARLPPIFAAIFLDEPHEPATSAMTTCTQSGRWSREYPWRRLSSSGNGGSASK